MAEEVQIISELSRNHLTAEPNQQIVVQLLVGPSAQFAREHPTSKCHLLLVLDASSSMNSVFAAADDKFSKRTGVLAATKAMIPAVDSDDTVSVVIFGSKASTVRRDAPGSDRAAVEKACEQIMGSTGSTNFEDAFKRVTEWADRHEDGSRKVIFLTDGQHTQGDWNAVMEANAALGRRGVTVDCLGVGREFAFSEMQALSEPTNGRTLLLSTPRQAESEFKELLKGGQRSHIHNVLLRFAVPPGFNDVEFYQYSPEVRFIDKLRRAPESSVTHEVRVGSLSQERRHEYLLSLNATPSPDSPSMKLVDLRLDYDIPALGVRGGSLEEAIRVEVGGREEVNTSVLASYAEASLEKDLDAFQEVLESDYKAAAKILQTMQGKAERYRLSEKAKMYREYWEKLVKGHNLSNKEINEILAKTSSTDCQPRHQTVGTELDF